MERMTKAGGKVFAWAAPGIFVIWYLLVAGVLLLTFRLMGGEGNFSQAFSATLYAWMPQVISSIIGTIVAVARGCSTRCRWPRWSRPIRASWPT